MEGLHNIGLIPSSPGFIRGVSRDAPRRYSTGTQIAASPVSVAGSKRSS